MTERKTYTYAVVSHNGASLYRERKRCSDARAAMKAIAETYPIAETFEIERIEHVPGGGGGRRYQMRQGSRWVPWEPRRNHTERRPDWIATSKGRVTA